VSAVIVGQWRFHMRLPARHIGTGEQTAMERASNVHEPLRAAELVDGLSNKTLRPDLARTLDLLHAIAGSIRCFAQNPLISVRQRAVCKHRTGWWHSP